MNKQTKLCSARLGQGISAADATAYLALAEELKKQMMGALPKTFVHLCAP